MLRLCGVNVTLKFGVYFGTFFVAALIAGFYGAIHDQISYSFSTEYFTHLKFIQFSIPWAYDHPRWGAAVVGALATWWMGVLVFIPLGLCGFIFPNPKTMFVHLVKSFGVVLIVALLTGIGGLIFGYFQVTENTIAQYMPWVRPEVTNPIQFVRVGFMHNASYLGGLTGLVAGVVYLLWSRRRLSKSRAG